MEFGVKWGCGGRGPAAGTPQAQPWDEGAISGTHRGRGDAGLGERTDPEG